MALESVFSRLGTASVPTAGNTQLSLRDGQLLNARIESLLPNGSARIASPLGNLEARLPADLRPGAALQLQVVRTGSDLKLVILDPAAPQTAGRARGGPPISGAVQAASGAQGSLAPLLANAGAAAAQPGGVLPTAIQATIEQLASFRLSSNGALNVDAVRDAVLNSGLFYEAKLASGAAPAALTGDMKAILFALQAALRSWLGGVPQSKPDTAKTAPPIRGGGLTAGGGVAAAADLRALSSPDIAQLLLAQTGAALARLRLAQFASLPEDPEGSRTGTAKGGAEWTFELPFALGEKTTIIQFQLSREPGSHGLESDNVWRIRFSLDIEPLGPVHAAIVWKHNQVAVTLWAETEDAAQRLRRQTSILNAALDSASLATDKIQVHAGRPEPGKPVAGAFVDRVT